MITLTAFRWVPPFAQGLVRDLRARWALEEAGFPTACAFLIPWIREASNIAVSNHLVRFLP